MDKFIVKLKGINERFDISKANKEILEKILSQPNDKIPLFVKIEERLVSVSQIASIEPDKNSGWL